MVSITETSVRELANLIYKQSIEALRIVEKHIYRTPILNNKYLDELVGYKTFLKLENLQLTGAFKIRGAIYKIHKLTTNCLVKGVVAATSGNHGLGVAHASKIYGIQAIIVMPKTASSVKVNSVRELGAEVIIHGDYLDEAYEKAMEICSRTNYVYIHSYDDIDTISGQATIAHEILDTVKPKYVLVPVGGGGLISGLAVVFKQRNPETKIIGIEPRNCPKMYNYIKHGLSETDVKPSIADAVVMKKPGRIASRIVEEYVDDIVTVDEKDIVEAIYFSITKLKTIVEGAGALPVASLLSNVVKIDSEPVVGVVTGGNIDPLILRDIIEKNDFGRRILLLKGVVEDNVHALNKVISILVKHNCRILNIYLSKLRPSVEYGRIYLEIIIEAKQLINTRDLVNELRNHGVELEVE